MLKIKFPDAPFVGHIGAMNDIVVVERPGILACKSRLGIVLITQLGTLFFGTLTTYIIWSVTHDPRHPHVPLIFMGLLILLAFVCWVNFFRNLLGTPHFEASAATGEISFFQRRTMRPWKTILPAEISKLIIEKQYYSYKARQTENAVLVLLTAAGERIALCASPDQGLIKSLGEKLAQLTQQKLE